MTSLARRFRFRGIEPPSEVDVRSDLLPPAETRVADPPAESS